jgi:hypothetical protein
MRSRASGRARFESRGQAISDARERVPTTQRRRRRYGYMLNSALALNELAVTVPVNASLLC